MAVRSCGSYRECVLDVNCSSFLELEINFRNCCIGHLWSDHLSSCHRCCCPPFQIEDHSCELHQTDGQKRSTTDDPPRTIQDTNSHNNISQTSLTDGARNSAHLKFPLPEKGSRFSFCHTRPKPWHDSCEVWAPRATFPNTVTRRLPFSCPRHQHFFSFSSETAPSFTLIRDLRQTSRFPRWFWALYNKETVRFSVGKLHSFSHMYKHFTGSSHQTFRCIEAHHWLMP